MAPNASSKRSRVVWSMRLMASPVCAIEVEQVLALRGQERVARLELVELLDGHHVDRPEPFDLLLELRDGVFGRHARRASPPSPPRPHRLPRLRRTRAPSTRRRHLRRRAARRRRPATLPGDGRSAAAPERDLGGDVGRRHLERLDAGRFEVGQVGFGGRAATLPAATGLGPHCVDGAARLAGALLARLVVGLQAGGPVVER